MPRASINKFPNAHLDRVFFVVGGLGTLYLCASVELDRASNGNANVIKLGDLAISTSLIMCALILYSRRMLLGRFTHPQMILRIVE